MFWLLVGREIQVVLESGETYRGVSRFWWWGWLRLKDVSAITPNGSAEANGELLFPHHVIQTVQVL